MLILIKIKIIFYTKLSYVILNLNPLFLILIFFPTKYNPLKLNLQIKYIAYLS
jgi:hypothetical protein